MNKKVNGSQELEKIGPSKVNSNEKKNLQTEMPVAIELINFQNGRERYFDRYHMNIVRFKPEILLLKEYERYKAEKRSVKI